MKAKLLVSTAFSPFYEKKKKLCIITKEYMCGSLPAMNCESLWCWFTHTSYMTMWWDLWIYMYFYQILIMITKCAAARCISTLKRKWKYFFAITVCFFKFCFKFIYLANNGSKLQMCLCAKCDEKIETHSRRVPFNPGLFVSFMVPFFVVFSLLSALLYSFHTLFYPQLPREWAFRLKSNKNAKQKWIRWNKKMESSSSSSSTTEHQTQQPHKARFLDSPEWGDCEGSFVAPFDCENLSFIFFFFSEEFEFSTFILKKKTEWREWCKVQSTKVNHFRALAHILFNITPYWIIYIYLEHNYTYFEMQQKQTHHHNFCLNAKSDLPSLNCSLFTIRNHNGADNDERNGQQRKE